MIFSTSIDKSIKKVEIGEKEFRENYDIIVVGLGTAGAIAAIAAGKNNLRVLAIEKLNCMGGTGTAGAVTGYYFGSKGGIYESLDEEVVKLERMGYTTFNGVNPDIKKYILEENVVKSGVKITYEATIIGVFLEGNIVKGIKYISKDGIKEVGCKVVIDCSGEAEVCFLAGCETKYGRILDKKKQTYSSVKVYYDEAEDKLRHYYDDVGYVDQIDGDDLTRGIIEGNSVHLEDRFDSNKRLLYIAPLIGIREGRFIVAEKNITLEGALNREYEDNALFYAYSNLDNHSKDYAFEDEEQSDWIVAGSLWGLNISVAVPLESMLPKGYEGIIAAGRCVGVDHSIALSVRMKRCMQKCGEAAAEAAVLAIKNSTSIRKVDYEELKKRLEVTRCYDENNRRPLEMPVPAKNEVIKFDWLTTAEDIKTGMESDMPGAAIWSAYRAGENFKNDLIAWLRASNENLSKHSAFALALLKDEAGLPILRKILEEGDSYFPKTSRKYNQGRGYVAIYLIGKLRDIESIPKLIEIMKYPSKTIKIEYNYDEYIANIQELEFQYFSHALMALIKIGDTHINYRFKIAEAIKKITNKEDFNPIITLKGPKQYIYSMKQTVESIIDNKFNEWSI
jgi:ribulose 1,5-bisphosphate synthetase/thiazole synthase